MRSTRSTDSIGPLYLSFPFKKISRFESIRLPSLQYIPNPFDPFNGFDPRNKFDTTNSIFYSIRSKIYPGSNQSIVIVYSTSHINSTRSLEYTSACYFLDRFKLTYQFDLSSIHKPRRKLIHFAVFFSLFQRTLRCVPRRTMAPFKSIHQILSTR